MKLAPYNPTHHEGVAIALELLELSSDDVLMDIGCGDGRLLTQVVVFFKYTVPFSRFRLMYEVEFF